MAVPNLSLHHSHLHFCITQSEDGTKVELIAPPDDAPIGERVTLEGLTETFEPQTANQASKKKTWKKVAEELKTADGGIATWQGKPIVTSKGPCKAPSLVGVPIS